MTPIETLGVRPCGEGEAHELGGGVPAARGNVRRVVCSGDGADPARFSAEVGRALAVYLRYGGESAVGGAGQGVLDHMFGYLDAQVRSDERTVWEVLVSRLAVVVVLEIALALQLRSVVSRSREVLGLLQHVPSATLSLTQGVMKMLGEDWSCSLP